MRWLIGALVIGNLIALLWGNLYSEPTAEERLPEPDVGFIRLLGETPDQAAPSPEPKQLTDAPAVADQTDILEEQTNSEMLEQVADDVVLAGQPIQMLTPPKFELISDQPDEPLTLESEDAQAAQNEIAAEAPVSETSIENASATVAAIVAEKSTILDTQEETEPQEAIFGGAPVEERVLEPINEPATPPQVVTNMCAKLGPYSSEAALNKVLAALPPEFVAGRITSNTVEVAAGHYVIIPAAKNLQEAKATLKKLKAAGIKDTWLFRSGRLQNAISLGLFSVPENARLLAGKVRKRGFETQVVQKYKEAMQYSLNIEHPDDLDIKDLLAPKIYKKYKKIDCG